MKLRDRKPVTLKQQKLHRKRISIVKALLLQSPATAPGAIVVFLLTVFGVFMFLDEVGR